jgi:serine/threonine-protein kinase
MRGGLFPDLKTGDEVGGFTVVRPLGRGGCGAVYLATRGAERFALKLQSLAHLGGWPEREAALLMRVRHPHVVGFRGCGLHPAEAPEWFFLAMEYVEGRTLHRWVEEENPGARTAAALVLGVARGLAALHAVGALHRDVKEENVMVREADGTPVLVDLGVGDYAGAPRLTQGVLPPGTPRYRSPEALDFRRKAWEDEARYTATPADDVYALGVVFYWVLCARYPFEAADTPTEVGTIIHQAPEAPHALNPRVPAALGALCLRMLAKRPGDRPGAGEVCEAVEALVAGADAGWDVPLCEAWADAPVEPRPPPADSAEALARWLEDGEGDGGPPRRGKKRAHPQGRPGAAAPPEGVPVLASQAEKAAAEAAGEPIPAPPPEQAPVPAPVPAAAPMPAPRHARVGSVWVAVTLAAVMAAGAWALARTGWPTEAGPAARAVGPGREVAPGEGPPESVRAAPPLPAEPSRAAAASEAAPPPKEEPTMKKTPAAAAPPSPAMRLLKSAGKTVATTLTCTGLACAGAPQPRPPPREAPCPPGALEAMSKLGVRVGMDASIIFDEDAENRDYVPVREGRIRMMLGSNFGKLSNGTALGELIVGSRVYIRFTEAWPYDGSESFPVCLELRAISGELGAPRAPGDTGDTTARALNNNRAEAVLRFR